MDNFFRIISIVMLLILDAVTIMYFAAGKYYPLGGIAVILFLVSAVAAKSGKTR